MSQIDTHEVKGQQQWHSFHSDVNTGSSSDSDQEIVEKIEFDKELLPAKSRTFDNLEMTHIPKSIISGKASIRSAKIDLGTHAMHDTLAEAINLTVSGMAGVIGVSIKSSELTVHHKSNGVPLRDIVSKLQNMGLK